MPIKELRAKYGPELKAQRAVNRAIRAEIPGGAECLDAVGAAFRLKKALRELGHPDLAEANRACAILDGIAAGMADEIARRYNLATSEKKSADRG